MVLWFDVSLWVGYFFLGCLLTLGVTYFVDPFGWGGDDVVMVPDVSIVNMGENTSLRGYIVPDKYIVLKTAGESEERIIETFFHEMGHLYVHRDSEHFVGFYLEEVEWGVVDE